VTFGFFGETSPGAKLLIAAVIIIPCGVIVASMIKSPNVMTQACNIAAAEWEAGNANGQANRASDVTHFAKQYNVFRQACPNGHKLVDESKISADVKAGYIPAKN
jgi:hypothetical protein